MTTYNRRNLPHPTLRPRGTDYVPEGRFSGEPQAIRRSAQSEEITVATRYQLSSPGLTDLIESGKAEYQSLTECVATRLRELHRSTQANHTITLQADRYQGEVILKPFVIAVEDIQAFRSDDWTDPVKRMLPLGTDLPSGAILAIGEQTTFDVNTATDQESYIEITPAESVQPSQYRIDLGGERIVIYINPNDKPAIDQTRANDDTLQYLYPSMYQRAIEEAIRQHQRDDHSGKRWAVRIADKLAEHGLDTQDAEALEAHSLEYAQQVMENPLARIITMPDYDQPSEE